MTHDAADAATEIENGSELFDPQPMFGQYLANGPAVITSAIEKPDGAFVAGDEKDQVRWRQRRPSLQSIGNAHRDMPRQSLPFVKREFPFQRQRAFQGLIETHSHLSSLDLYYAFPQRRKGASAF